MLWRRRILVSYLIVLITVVVRILEFFLLLLHGELLRLNLLALDAFLFEALVLLTPNLVDWTWIVARDTPSDESWREETEGDNERNTPQESNVENRLHLEEGLVARDSHEVDCK